MDDESLTVQLLDATFFNEFMLIVGSKDRSCVSEYRRVARLEAGHSYCTTGQPRAAPCNNRVPT
eukprot:scaffold21118_cov88-Skeletonema_marinoi.AAC.1